MEDDLILDFEEKEKDAKNPLDVIDNQLAVIGNVADLDHSVYDECLEDKIKVITRALKLIFKIQGNLLKDV